MTQFAWKPPIVVGNWKCNGGSAFVRSWAAEFAAAGRDRGAAMVGVCPPVPFVAELRNCLPAAILVGVQNIGAWGEGAYTGEVSGGMAAEAGGAFTLVGHSERRRLCGEDDDVVRTKLCAAADAGLGALLCVGETEEERGAGRTGDVLRGQIAAAAGNIDLQRLAGIAVGYEPVWAIGSGRTPSADEIGAAHAEISACVGEIAGEQVKIPVLYGGSVSERNVSDIAGISGVDGVLVGGASLDAGVFARICMACSGDNAS